MKIVIPPSTIIDIPLRIAKDPLAMTAFASIDLSSVGAVAKLELDVVDEGLDAAKELVLFVKVVGEEVRVARVVWNEVG